MFFCHCQINDIPLLSQICCCCCAKLSSFQCCLWLDCCCCCCSKAVTIIIIIVFIVVVLKNSSNVLEVNMLFSICSLQVIGVVKVKLHHLWFPFCLHQRMKKLVKNILEMDEIDLLFSVILEKYKFITFLCINGVLLYVCDVPLCCKNCFSVHARVRKGKQNEMLVKLFIYVCIFWMKMYLSCFSLT